MKYRKKPVVIEALHIGPETTSDDIYEFTKWEEFSVSDGADSDTPIISVEVETLEGTMIANQGDWLIKGIQGEFYPCKPDIFEKTYEKVKDQSDE